MDQSAAQQLLWHSQLPSRKPLHIRLPIQLPSCTMTEPGQAPSNYSCTVQSVVQQLFGYSNLFSTMHDTPSSPAMTMAQPATRQQPLYSQLPSNCSWTVSCQAATMTQPGQLPRQILQYSPLPSKYYGIVSFKQLSGTARLPSSNCPSTTLVQTAAQQLCYSQLFSSKYGAASYPAITMAQPAAQKQPWQTPIDRSNNSLGAGGSL
jgi:hypothetical protein